MWIILVAALAVQFQFYPDRDENRYCGVTKIGQDKYVACGKTENEVINQIKKNIKEKKPYTVQYYDKVVK